MGKGNLLNTERLEEIQYIYKKSLLHDIIPFWMNFSIDWEHGGYYHYLDRNGSVLCKDKAVWLQNRSVWFFSKLYNDIENKTEWLSAAENGYQFIKNHCFDDDGRMFFLVDSQGKKLRKRRYWFTETFGVLGFSEYAKASKDEDIFRLAHKTYEKIVDLYNHPEKLQSKFYTENRHMRSLAASMLLMSTTQVIRDVAQDEKSRKIYSNVIDSCIKDVRNFFFKKNQGALLETTGIDGSIIDTPDGRTINPGHSIETAWFIMEEGLYRGNWDIVSLGLEILDASFVLGWDDQYGGLFSFVDIYGKPSEHVEWDMKYWWPHTETLYALLLAYVTTKDEKYLAAYEDVHAWTFDHFPDYEFGEWYGYLHRDGSPALQIKGSQWKGNLHIPRLLIQGIKLIERCLKE
ncbi:MAG: AGE family epimerase/isomerase [Spirochaetia bacterium]|nr:AGE family epimerase/isomerase [Spirochaetia bacterium]MCF7945566.1 AGE family epimerase/isomerase [Spirochaetia bacterium]